MGRWPWEDVHRLPVLDASVDPMVNKDTLEHLLEPQIVVLEVHQEG